MRHTYYPSLVSISDKLSFFNIDNGVLSVETSEIELLPDYFVALFENIEHQIPLDKKNDIQRFVKKK